MKSRLSILVVSILLLFSMSTGCIGNFGLSGKVRKFNLETTEDRWGREILFVVLYVIPVYPFAGFLDIIVFNSIEFWTGTNQRERECHAYCHAGVDDRGRHASHDAGPAGQFDRCQRGQT